MRGLVIISFLLFEGVRAATSGQDSHLIKDVEIPLNDFPYLMAGYRIQIGAFNSEKAAIELKQSLQETFGQKARLNYAENLWRIRLGDFADSVACRDFLTSRIIPAGFLDAFMVEDRLPIASEMSPRPQTEPGFRLQIAVLSNRENAIAKAKDAACNVPDLRPHVLWVDSLYKIQLGDFRSDSEAMVWKAELEQVDSLQAVVVPAPVYGPTPPPPSQKTQEKDIFQYDD